MESRGVSFTAILVLLVLIGFLSLSSGKVPEDCPAGLVSYWRFDGNGVDDINGKNSEVSGAEFDIGRISQALFLKSDSGRYAQVQNDRVFEPDDFTIQFWVNQGLVVDSVFLDKGDYRVYSESGFIRAEIAGTTLESSVSTARHKWHFVALSWDGGEAVLYIGGIEEDRETLSGIAWSGSDLYVGKEEGASVNFMGSIDELAFFDRALSPEEIVESYDLTRMGKNYCHSPSDVSSSVRVKFNIAGCDLTGLEGGSDVGIAVGQCSTNGRWFCAGSGDVQDSLSVLQACSNGHPDTPEWPERSCCPVGYYCDETSHVCELRDVDCSGYTDVDECTENECLWIRGHCIDPREPSLSCSFYGDAESCHEDVYNLGQLGAGTDVCGNYLGGGVYFVAMESCICEWVGPVVGCAFKYKVSQAFGSDPEWFECLKSFAFGECITGSQEVSQTTSAIPDTFAPDHPMRIAGGCVDDSFEQSCGQKVVKLSGFSFANVVFVLVILGGYYWARRVRKEERVQQSSCQLGEHA